MHTLCRSALLLVLCTSVYSQSPNEPSPAFRKAFAFFRSFEQPSLQAVLAKVRKAPASPAHQRAVLLSFQKAVAEGGEVTAFTQDERGKLDGVSSVLALFDRTHLQIRVIDVPNAYVGLHRRVVLLISLPALRLLTGSELQAISAHEAGHDFFWPRWESARAASNRESLQEIELLCDGLAILAAFSLRLDSSVWLSGLEKLESFNQQRFGAAAYDSSYPLFAERRRFAEALRSRLGALLQEGAAF